MKNATFRQLRFFNAVARHLSFARAAEDLHVSAPAVTMQIKELEAEVGMPLFERQGRKISLTTSGEYMLVYSRRMMALLKDAEDAAARLQRVETGSLTIGLVGTTTYFIPALLSASNIFAATPLWLFMPTPTMESLPMVSLTASSV